MKKTLLFVLSLFFVFCTITCDTDIGLGSSVDGTKIDSPFTGGTWENENRNISFTKDSFTFTHNFDVYVGKYKTTKHTPNGRNPPQYMITFSNSEPHINGKVEYLFDYKIGLDGTPPEDSVWFYQKDNEWYSYSENFLLAGFFNKVN